MLRKLLSWRPSSHNSQTTLALILPSNTTVPSLSRFSSRSLSDDPYDPPFSPTTKPKKTQKKAPTSDKHQTQNRPLRSDLPFDFRYSYSETNPSVEPIGFREPPRFSPFGPGRLDRSWTGTSAPANHEVDLGTVEQARNQVLGDPLSEEEVAELVERYRHSDCARQINLGKGGVTHNTLDDIHNHWRRAEAVRIKCLGVPTLDMDNICFHLELLCRINVVGRLSTGTLTSCCYIGVETMIQRTVQSFL